MMAPVLAQDVGGVGFARDMVEGEHIASAGLADAVVAEGVVAFLEAGVGYGGTDDDREVIAEQVGAS